MVRRAAQIWSLFAVLPLPCSVLFSSSEQILVMFDTNDRQSFRSVQAVLDQISEYTALSEAPTPSTVCILVGCKSDLGAEVTMSEAQEMATAHSARYLQCSAKTGEGVDEVMSTGIRLAMRQRPAPPQSVGVGVGVGLQPHLRDVSPSLSDRAHQAGRRLFGWVLGS